jgi:hypothetical protein
MKNSKQMAEEVYNVPFCRRCRKPLTKKQIEKAKKKGSAIVSYL